MSEEDSRISTLTAALETARAALEVANQDARQLVVERVKAEADFAWAMRLLREVEAAGDKHGYFGIRNMIMSRIEKWEQANARVLVALASRGTGAGEGK